MKKLISLILVILIFIPTVYATGSTPDTSSSILVLLMDLTNILWLPFAFIAWELLTNDFVYGTFLDVDKVLWNIWNISRTAAMIILWAMFVYFIFMTFFSKEQWVKAIKELPKIIIAAVLINMSFFLLWALIDISTVLIWVAGQLPKTIVSEDTNNKKLIRVCNKYKVGWKTKWETKELLECTNRTQNIKIKDYLDWIANSSWLLVYLASSVLHIDQLSNIPWWKSMSLKSMTTATAIKVITSLLFIVPLIILIITNIVRIFRIWLYVAFAPLIALDIVFGNKIWSKMPKNQAFTLPNIIWMIFQPVLVVAALSLVVIFMTMLQITFADKNSKGLEALQINMEWEKVEMKYWKDDKTLLTINGNLWIKDDVTSWFGQIIISLIWVLLMWGILKASFTFSKVTSSVSESLFEFWEQSAKAVPIIGGVWYWAMKMVGDKKIFKRWFKSTAASQAQPIVDAMNKAFWIELKDITMSKKASLLGKLRYTITPWKKLKILEELIKDGIEKNITLASSPNFRDVAGAILEDLHIKHKWLKLIDDKEKIRDRNKYFLDNNNPGTQLIMGMYMDIKNGVKTVRRDDGGQLKPIIKSWIGSDVHKPFEKK